MEKIRITSPDWDMSDEPAGERTVESFVMPLEGCGSDDEPAAVVDAYGRELRYIGVRRDGFDDPVRVDVGALPGGVSVDLKEIPAGSHLTPVVFEAGADAPLGAALLDLKGVASTPGGTVTGGFQQVVDLIPGVGDSSYESVSVGKLAVVVTEAVPYSVSLSAPGTSLAQDGAIDLVATVERAEGFAEAIEVSFPFLRLRRRPPTPLPKPCTSLSRAISAKGTDSRPWNCPRRQRVGNPSPNGPALDWLPPPASLCWPTWRS